MNKTPLIHDNNSSASAYNSSSAFGRQHQQHLERAHCTLVDAGLGFVVVVCRSDRFPSTKLRSNRVNLPESSTTMSNRKRRLWLSPEEFASISNSSNNKSGRITKSIQKDDQPTDTYESLFQAFSQRPEPLPLSFYLQNTLPVGQEFVLTVLLLAGHRAAMANEATNNNHPESSSFRSSHDNLWIALALIWCTLILSVLQTRFATSQQYQLKHRLTDFGLMAVLLRFLSAVLKTLTASYSSNTVYALSIAALFLHLLACNYAYANGWSDEDDDNNIDETKESNNPSRRPLFKGGTLSLTSVFFATALLASRLQQNVTVYLFVCGSVVLFALYPAARHLVAVRGNAGTPIVVTAILTGAAMVLLESQQEIVGVCVMLALILVLVPLWKHHLQQYKVTLRGPWDIAHV